jgi:hypothetical protein
MSYVVATSTDTFTRGQDRPGGVPVSAWLTSAGLAPEGSHTQPTTRRVAPSAPRTGDRGVDGRHQHHRSARPHGTLEQLPFRCTDRSILALTSHRERGQNFRFEVLHGNHVMVVNHGRSPNTPCVRVLVRGLVMQPRSCAACTPVTARRGTTGAAPRHLRLGFRQLASTPLPITRVGKVEPRFGGRGCGGRPSRCRCREKLRSRDRPRRAPRTTQPMLKPALVDPDTGGYRWQLFGPHHGNAHTCQQAQTSVTDRESSGVVLQRREGPLAALKLRSPTTLDLARVVQRRRVRPQHLLRGGLREPRKFAGSAGEKSRQATQCGTKPRLLLINSLVPQEPAPPPEQRTLALNARAQAVRLARGLAHLRNVTASITSPPNTGGRPIAQRPYLATARAGSFWGAFR